VEACQVVTPSSQPLAAPPNARSHERNHDPIASDHGPADSLQAGGLWFEPGTAHWGNSLDIAGFAIRRRRDYGDAGTADGYQTSGGAPCLARSRTASIQRGARLPSSSPHGARASVTYSWQSDRAAVGHPGDRVAELPHLSNARLRDSTRLIHRASRGGAVRVPHGLGLGSVCQPMQALLLDSRQLALEALVLLLLCWRALVPLVREV